jgi:AcrR family transcriptional regulator
MIFEEEPLGRQAQKAKNTREKIIAAAIALIKEGGISNASSGNIAQRAGTTWGAAQHHFGSKEEILDAIMDISHANFSALMADPAMLTGALADRVELFVERMWQHYQSDVYLAALEILMAARGGPENTPSMWTEQQARGHLQTLRNIFFDCALADQQMLENLEFVHCFLTGLTIERLFDPKPRRISLHLRRIKQWLLMGLAS